MAITHTRTNTFIELLFNGGISFDSGTTDQYKMALYTDLATLGVNTTVYTTDNEVSGTGYAAGGLVLTLNPNTVLDTVANVAYVSFNNPEWPGASFTARGALVYCSTAGNAALAVINFGENKTVSSGTFRVDLPPANSSNAILRIS